MPPMSQALCLPNPPASTVVGDGGLTLQSSIYLRALVELPLSPGSGHDGLCYSAPQISQVVLAAFLQDT